MKQQYDFLPRRLSKEEIALAPANWVRVLSHYSYRRRRALWEKKPGYHTLLAPGMAAIAKKNRDLIDIAAKLTRDNVPRYIHLSLVSSALRSLGGDNLRYAVHFSPVTADGHSPAARWPSAATNREFT